MRYFSDENDDYLLDYENLRNRTEGDFDRVFDRSISKERVCTCVLKEKIRHRRNDDEEILPSSTSRPSSRKESNRNHIL